MIWQLDNTHTEALPEAEIEEDLAQRVDRI